MTETLVNAMTMKTERRIKTIQTGLRALVHEVVGLDTKFRYFVTLDGKLTPATALALELGAPGWTRKEALDKADTLNRRCAMHSTAIAAAAEQFEKFPTADNQYTLKRQQDALAAFLARYTETL